MEQKQDKQNLLPTIFVILGATGDLMRRKLTPALFHLYEKGDLPPLFQVIGFSRDELTVEGFRKMVAGIVRERVPGADQSTIEKFVKFFAYQHGFFEEDKGYREMASYLGRKDGEWMVCANKLFYIAASPQFYETIFRKLASSGLTKPCSPKEGWTRVIVEKPFGKDLKTAQALDALLGKLFKEEQIYRIDHYLGKETVQNILAFRFSNSFLQGSWNAKAVESIKIQLFEKEGVGNRGGFYDGIGTLRDVGQNHVLQLLALFTMENPGAFDGSSIRRARAQILRSLRSLKPKEIEEATLRGQYEGYTSEKNVAPDSQTETYFRIETFLDASRWKGVPVILESGKEMSEDRVDVIVTFRHYTPCLCPPASGKHYQNVLYYHIQPREGIDVSFWVKKPGPEMTIEERGFSFDYKKAFEGTEFSDAYERLLLHVIRGDQTLFVSTQEIMAEWKFVDPILRAWQQNKVPLTIYKKHSSEIDEST
ncbi:MAG: glucose-6-phosphate dehydrogenase [Patescibacteria group bacterium]